MLNSLYKNYLTTDLNQKTHMEQTAYNLLDLISSLNNLFIAFAALLLTMIGLWGAYVQLEKLKESALTNIHTKWCDQSFELIQFFASKPGIRDYFYCRKAIDPILKGHDLDMIYYSAEALANFIDQLLPQKQYLPLKQWAVWERFIDSSFRLSIVLGEFIVKNKDWYSEELFQKALASLSATQTNGSLGQT